MEFSYGICMEKCNEEIDNVQPRICSWPPLFCYFCCRQTLFIVDSIVLGERETSFEHLCTVNGGVHDTF